MHKGLYGTLRNRLIMPADLPCILVNKVIDKLRNIPEPLPQGGIETW
ncbi:hypothetical protein JXL19_04860 [bacterium]|nr:hypothetical protein [bacterium]